MKYFRGKDKIVSEARIRETNHNEDGSELSCEDVERIAEWFVNEIIKQADSVEELCDVFVGVLENGEGSHVWYDEPEDEYYFQGVFERIKSYKDEYEIIYGAIWTDKGLIYVAKVNNKGELELL